MKTFPSIVDGWPVIGKWHHYHIRAPNDAPVKTLYKQEASRSDSSANYILASTWKFTQIFHKRPLFRRDLLFNENIRQLNMADTSLDRFTRYEMIQISLSGFNFWSHPKVIFNLKGHICDCSMVTFMVIIGAKSHYESAVCNKQTRSFTCSFIKTCYVMLSRSTKQNVLTRDWEYSN